MTDFHTFTMRHGEATAQALIESLENYKGLRHTMVTPLEDRWNAVMMVSGEQKKAA